MIQYRKQLLSCSQSSSSALITEIENIFSSHIVIHFEINPGMCSHYSVHIIHLKFSVSQTFALHYKARCVSIIGLAEGRYQRGAAPAPDSDKVSSINKYLHCLPLGTRGRTTTYLNLREQKQMNLANMVTFYLVNTTDTWGKGSFK